MESQVSGNRKKYPVEAILMSVIVYIVKEKQTKKKIIFFLDQANISK